MRGEHVFDEMDGSTPEGSSPHARGAPGHLYFPSLSGGIIPACAGSTMHGSERLQDKWDHPRMRGEHLDVRKGVEGSVGSSPHARGARFRAQRVFLLGGIIPACAGSTRCRYV